MPTTLKTTSVKFEDKVYVVNYLIDVWIVAETSIYTLTIRGADNEIPVNSRHNTVNIG
jgi:hypothetical protein